MSTVRLKDMQNGPLFFDYLIRPFLPFPSIITVLHMAVILKNVKKLRILFKVSSFPSLLSSRKYCRIMTFCQRGYNCSLVVLHSENYCFTIILHA